MVVVCSYNIGKLNTILYTYKVYFLQTLVDYQVRTTANEELRHVTKFAIPINKANQFIDDAVIVLNDISRYDAQAATAINILDDVSITIS